LSILKAVSTLSLSELLGWTVYDCSGSTVGRVREAALVPQEDRSRVSALIVKTRAGSRILPCGSISVINGSVRASTLVAEWHPSTGTEGQFFLGRDLLDQQVIDVHGRKVVRVNDVDFYLETIQNHLTLKIEGVDVGARGAIRRLLKGVVPFAALRILLQRIPPREIPWEFVDLIETDPSRRVKLKISHERIAKLHSADIAHIAEDLTSTERDAVFETPGEPDIVRVKKGHVFATCDANRGVARDKNPARVHRKIFSFRWARQEAIRRKVREKKRAPVRARRRQRRTRAQTVPAIPG